MELRHFLWSRMAIDLVSLIILTILAGSVAHHPTISIGMKAILWLTICICGASFLAAWSMLLKLDAEEHEQALTHQIELLRWSLGGGHRWI